MYLTIEDLITKTGYSKATIYNLCVKLGIRAQKGRITGNIGKGVYSKEDLNKLLEYKEGIEKGIAKEEMYERLNPST